MQPAWCHTRGTRSAPAPPQSWGKGVRAGGRCSQLDWCRRTRETRSAPAPPRSWGRGRQWKRFVKKYPVKRTTDAWVMVTYYRAGTVLSWVMAKPSARVRPNRSRSALGYLVAPAMAPWFGNEGKGTPLGQQDKICWAISGLCLRSALLQAPLLCAPSPVHATEQRVEQHAVPEGSRGRTEEADVKGAWAWRVSARTPHRAKLVAPSIEACSLGPSCRLDPSAPFVEPCNHAGSP